MSNMIYKFKCVREADFKKYKDYIFLTGVFFLPSSLLISLILFLPVFIIGSFKRENYFKDKWNCLLFITGLLISISAALQNLFIENIYQGIWDPKLSLIGIINWIPFFWIFWASQPYLSTSEKRKNFALALVSGTLPVILTGFAQYFLNWTGPYSVLNGLITWYQKPIESPGGLSGLFSNQNYAGSWFNIVWPFCIALLLKKSKSLINKIIEFSFLIFVGFSAFLTNSRNAWIGIITSLLITLGKKRIRWTLPTLLMICLLIFLGTSSIFSGSLQDLIKSLIPKHILMEFADEGYVGLDVTRIEILKSAISLILSRPIFGFGAASFTSIYEFQTTYWKGHSHNLFVELAISYGLPVSILLFSFVIGLLIVSSKEIFFNKDKSIIKNYFDKALWTSIFIFYLSQFVDIHYFEGRLSLISWILMAGLRMIIYEVKKT